MILEPLQTLLTLSLKVSDATELQSCATATPVAFVLVSVAGQSSTTSAAAWITRPVVSRTVIRWTQVLTLPQSSTALQVRSMTSMVAPGKTGGCTGSGPKGGCGCGGGRSPILDRFPSESVWTPTVISTGGSEAFWA